MRVSELIQALSACNPAALVVLHDYQEPDGIRELQSHEIKPVTVRYPHLDRAPKLDDSSELREDKMQAIILGSR